MVIKGAFYAPIFLKGVIMDNNVKENLTDKQEKFCREYVLCLCKTQAAIKAGYSKKTAGVIASKLMQNPKIKDYIQELRKTEDEEFYYSRKRSFERLEEIQKLALENVEIKYTKEGEKIVIPKPDLKAFLKAEELKCKLHGFYNLTKEKDVLNVNTMGKVLINNNVLDLSIGSED